MKILSFARRTSGKIPSLTLTNAVDVSRTKLNAGEHDLSDEHETETFVTSSVRRDIEKHPRFYIRRGDGVIKYDAAILTLEDPVDFARFPHIR